MITKKILLVSILCVTAFVVCFAAISEDVLGIVFSEIFKSYNSSKVTIEIKRSATSLKVRSDKRLHPEWEMHVVQLIRFHGYPVETHTVKTKDGYLLIVHRIPHGRYNYKLKKQPAVLIMPGILCSSAAWVLNGPKTALAYILADKGYDVWLGNARGTTFGRRHVRLNPDINSTFWNFSFHEIGIFDIPATIDYILRQVHQKSLYYIAHSQGTTSFFVMMSELPEYKAKIQLMTALAPVVFTTNLINPILRHILEYFNHLEKMAYVLEINEILSHSSMITTTGQVMCRDGTVTQNLCATVLFKIAGYDEPQLNKTLLPLIFRHVPAGASVKQAWHFAYNMQAKGKFQKYNYGPKTNLKLYGRTTPPKYSLWNITVPVAIYYSSNDLIASSKDVEQLIKQLPNVVRRRLVRNRLFNHLDYMWAKDAKSLVYDRIVEDLSHF